MFKRIAALALIILSLTLQACASDTAGLQAYADNIDGYTFMYPNGWAPIKVPGSSDVVFHDLIEETENVSVVVSDITSDTQLTDLGDPTEVARTLLNAVIAPSQSGQEADLLAAASRTEDDKVYYALEYSIDLPIGKRHNLSTVVVRRGKLFTLSLSTPESRWTKVEPVFQRVVDSFSVY